MVSALAISALIGWLSGLAFAVAVVGPTRSLVFAAARPLLAVLPALDLSGPYYAFLPMRGNRPPPHVLLA